VGFVAARRLQCEKHARRSNSVGNGAVEIERGGKRGGRRRDGVDELRFVPVRPSSIFKEEGVVPTLKYNGLKIYARCLMVEHNEKRDKGSLKTICSKLITIGVGEWAASYVSIDEKGGSKLNYTERSVVSQN